MAVAAKPAYQVDRPLIGRGVRLILFDIVFDAPTDPANDAALAPAIKRAGNVILAETSDVRDDRPFSRVINIRPLALFESSVKATGIAKIRRTTITLADISRSKSRGGEPWLPQHTVRWGSATCRSTVPVR